MYRTSISYPFPPRLREHPKREGRKAKSWGLGNAGAERCPLDTTVLLHSWTTAPAGAACTGPAQDQARQHSSMGVGGAHELMAARAGKATWLLVGWPCSSG